MSDIKTLLARLEELEMKLAFQDDTIDSLNETVARQEMELVKLWEANKIIKQSLNELKTDSGDSAPEPPPPHY